MAGRVNTRFVIVLTVLLAVLGLGLAGFMVLQARRDPGRYIARAEQLMTEGQYMDAARQFGRAYSYEKGNEARVKILLDRADALSRVEATTTREAQELMAGIIKCWETAIDLVPSNVEASEQLLKLRYEQADSNNALIALWNNLYQSADQLLKYDPDNAVARRFRGIAHVRRIEQLNLGESALNEAMADLQQSLEADPGDVDVTYHMAMGKRIAANAAERVAEAEQADRLRREADQLIDAMVDKQPDNVDALLAKFEYDFRNAVRHRDQEAAEAAVQVLDRAEQLLLERDLPEQTMFVAGQLQRFDNERMELEDGRITRRGLYRSEQLLRHLVKRHPDNAMALVALGTNLIDQFRFDDAEAFFVEAKKDRPVPLTIAGLRTAEARAVAMKELADLYLVRRDRSDDPAERKQLLGQAVTQIDELEAMIGEQAPLTNLMRGKIALAQGERLEAISLLEKTSAQLEGRNIEALEQLARAYQQTGQTGAAATTLERLINAPGGNTQIVAHLQLAQLRLAADDPDAAGALVDRILSIMPGNIQAVVLKSQIETRKALRANPEDREAAVAAGLAVLDTVEDADNRAISLQRANLHQQKGDTARARAILDGYLADHPDDVRVLQQIVRLDVAMDQRDAAVARVERALADDPDNDVLKIMRSSLVGGDDLGQQVENIIAQQDDPLDKQLAFYRYYQQTNQPDKAQAALQQAMELAPDDARILGLQFDRAIAAEDWATAKQIVERAKQMNDGQGLDYAGGAFWQGRLEMARRDYVEAAATLERGLKQMPTNSSAQLLLARALMMVGDANGAERAIRRALDLKPDDLSAWLLLHSIHDRRGQHAEALTDLERAMRFGGANNPAVFNQYLSYLGQHGDVAKAIEVRRQIAEQRPEDQANRRALAQLYLNSDQPDQAKATLDALLADDPDDLSNVAMMAIYYASQDQFPRGRDMMLERLEQRRASGQVTASDWATYARFLRAGNQVEDALAAYRRAIALEDAQQRPFTREMADWLFSLGRFDDAASAYQTVLGSATEEDPQGKLLVWRRYVETLLNANRDDQARAELNELLEQHPADYQSLLIRGLMLRRQLAEADDLSDTERQKITEQIELALDQAVAYSRNDPTPHLQRALFRFNRDDAQMQQLVFEDLRRAREIEPSAIRPRELLAEWHRRHGEVDAAIGELRRLIVVRPTYAPARAKLAELYLAQGDRMVELEQLLRESQAQVPGIPAWHQYRARMYQAQGRFPEAEAEMAKAYELDGESLGRLGEYAGLLVRMGRFQRTLDLLADQPQAVGRQASLMAVKARALHGLGRTDEAMAAYHKALDIAGSDIGQLNAVTMQIQPTLSPEAQLALLEPRAENDPTGTLGLIVARLKLQHDDLDAAVKRLESLAGIFDARSDLETERHRLLARAYYTKDRLDEAREAYEAVLANRPDDLLALNNLAYLLADDLGDPAAALPLAERAVRSVGNNPQQRANVLDTLGWVQFRNNDMAAAEDTLKLSIGLTSMVANHLHLAQVYTATQRPTLARRQLMSARELAEKQKDTQALEQIESMLADLPTTAANAER